MLSMVPSVVRSKFGKCKYLQRVRRQFGRLLAAVSGVLWIGHALALDIQSIERPPETSMTWIGERIEHNGMPMQILQLSSTLTTEQLFKFYRELWQPMHAENEQATMERRAGDWHIISTLLDDHNVVVQLKSESGRTNGFLSATPLDKQPDQSEITRRFPRQWGTELISSTVSTDGGTRATTLVLKNSHSIESNHDFYTRTLQNNGWTLSHQNVQMGGSVMFFDNSSGAVELAIRRDNSSTLIFANVRGEGV